MLTRAGFVLLTTGSFLFLAALPTGNLVLLTLALIPLVFLLVAALGATPRKIHTRLEMPRHAVRVGERVAITLHYEIHGGRGVVELYQPLPGIFTLESGNNLHIVIKNRPPKYGKHTFHVRAPRRGRFELSPTAWEHVGALGLTGSRRGTSGEGGVLEVRPALRIVRRMIQPRSRAAIPKSSQQNAALGEQSTEFREIREYHRGDPPRSINWKATARLDARRRGRQTANTGRPTNGAPGGGIPPPHQLELLVNEYEREGRHNTWVYLDCGPHMRVGTTAENAFEAAVAATIGVAGHLLAQGHRVGLTLYNREEPLHIYPDTGRRQLYVVQSRLSEAEPTDTEGGLPVAVAQTKRFLVQSRTRVIIVTRAEKDTESLTEGIRLVERFTTHGRQRPSILVASPDPYALLPPRHEGTQAARQVIAERQRSRHDAIRRLGADLLVWDPTTKQFEEVIARRAMTR